jgi:teichuronic acid biosynthesis glycosyltransferase TuaC
MRILVLSKRQYMGKDLLDDRFGRFREIPLELARMGHNVKGFAISYRRREEGLTEDSDAAASATVGWHCINASRRFCPRVGTVVSHAVQIAKNFKPDLIWAASDAYVTTFGAWLATRSGTRCVIDLYDNFEAFRASKFPGVLPLFRRAVKKTDGVTCFSTRMANHVTGAYGRSKPTAVIESAMRSDLFYPQDRNVCRQRLGLPLDGQIIGTAGALDSSRGIETLFGAYEQLAKKHHDLHLALAGPRKARLPIPKGPRIHDLGNLPHESVPRFINSLDVSIICYRHSPQGEFSFPQKAYEIAACRAPLVAAAVGSMNELLQGHPECLYEPENLDSLATAIRRQLQLKTTIETPVPSWADSARQLDVFFQRIVDGDSRSAIISS